MKFLLGISRAVDAVTTVIGQSVSWLLLAAVLISATNAVVRKIFDMSSNAWLEVQWYLYGAVFMLAAAYALLKNEHVRIDILSSTWSKRTRDVMDLVLHVIFLIPFAGLMTYLAWPWFWNSFSSGEMSSNAGGLVIWPAKLVVLLGFSLLLLQAFSEIIKRYAVIAGYIADPREQGLSDSEAENNETAGG
ncbi:TRAP-type mannitol/chloroaromatic compound transport system, small permease component [Agrobacterium fabrum]|uniref:TRAP transporter small permease protein n=1 Tax=Agrobacterium fabrum TaxID=1176649 RepID=A0A7Z7BNX0_9HYPH|nr:TRAP transporter small permease subunit [Agrobacterium tumefaciens]WCJ65594.1 TRAP transporter small permease subunit [Agrobacterium tumefaciens]SDJ85595.1 TRAP-type mannitol/chloroaromatic compound transport system, small permease component [Agrobacterium fabrum]